MEQKQIMAGPGILINDYGATIKISNSLFETGSYQISGMNILCNSLEPYHFRKTEPNSVLMTDDRGSPVWSSAEKIISSLIDNPTIRDRIEKLIAARKDLEMTIKLCKE